MIQTLTIDIISDEAMKLIHKMETMKLIRVRRKSTSNKKKINWISKYKGAMYKQPLREVDNQLLDLRSSWD